jgi:hypothetical protein
MKIHNVCFTHSRVFFSMVLRELERHYWQGLLPATLMPTS